MASTAHRASHRCASRNSRRLPQGGRDRGTTAQPGAWGRRVPAKPANEVTTDPADSKPANEVTTDFSPPIPPPTGNQERVTSTCEPFRESIEQGLGRGRNAMAIWQDLVSDYGFPHGCQTVKRFVHKLRGSTPPQAVGIIQTAAGEEGQVDYRFVD
jgi:hypothetical protein